MTAIIELNNLSVQFHQKGRLVTAVKDATLHIEKGDIYGVIGYSGAGKSTLVRTINLLQKPTKGQIVINGEKIFDSENPVKFTGAKLREFRQKIGMIFQHFNLLSEKTVFNNVAFALQHSQIEDKNGKKRYLTKKEKTDKVTELLKLVDLEELSDKYPAQLSGGQKQRLAIAHALSRKPEIIIFDDSFSALDYKTDRKLREDLKEKTKEMTKLIVAQRISTIMDADQILVLDEGKIVGQGTHKELLANNSVYQEIAYSQLSKEELENGK